MGKLGFRKGKIARIHHATHGDTGHFESLAPSLLMMLMTLLPLLRVG